jgi:AbrB family looped-hinge helix DNA binding protein
MMTVTLKSKTEITVPKSVRRKAGFKPGDQVEFKVSDKTITIVPKLTPDEIQDEREIRDPKVRASIRKSYEEFLAGKSRPIQELFAERAARATRLDVGEHDTCGLYGSHHSALRSAFQQAAKE